MKINEKTGLYENYGTWHVPFWQTDSFLLGIKIAAGLLCLLIFICAIIIYVRYKKRKKLSPSEQLLADLQQLQIDHKVQIACGKEFYMSLSDIIKRYFFYCFHYDVLGKTDSELINYLRQVHVDQQLIEDIKDIVQGSEIIKFANAQAAQEKIACDYNNIVSLVKQAIFNKK
jgi:hypothetical protein